MRKYSAPSPRNSNGKFTRANGSGAAGAGASIWGVAFIIFLPRVAMRSLFPSLTLTGLAAPAPVADIRSDALCPCLRPGRRGGLVEHVEVVRPAEPAHLIEDEVAAL